MPPLYRISDTGGVSTPVTKIHRESSAQVHRWPFFLPDGKHFLYFVDWSAPNDPQGNGVYVGSLDSGTPKLISSELTGNVAFASGRLLYVRDRSLVAQPFNSSRFEFTGPPVSIAEQEITGALWHLTQMTTATASLISSDTTSRAIYPHA